ncbi:unnamed protein product [Didymodactylos carnosus]|uniref:Integrase zinc-binding domain-containing protein n=1 Tax=Didymodactylos carnosus TaxID=1234261 RepID=A0A815G506_9BILA|nr:unnamed protein product [Didymodactylos carnosus]CAF1334076.1 unnamed protein product [Didymodactylos carnosus]CAF3705101.1 unnamed protein product [Didymodactylos carnosus]CAF4190119.1 unnamed protein product [Didymodactylos carnosus]
MQDRLQYREGVRKLQQDCKQEQTTERFTSDSASDQDSIDLNSDQKFSCNKFDIKQLKIEQDKDSNIKLKIEQLKKDPNKIGFVLKDDILYKLVQTKYSIRKKPVPYIPPSMISVLLEASHNDPLSGHFAIHRTLAKLKHQFWWPDMKSSVEKYIRSYPVIFAYNTGVHSSTKFSPYVLQFGRRPRLPIDPPPTQLNLPNPSDYHSQNHKQCLPPSSTSRFETITLVWQNILDRHKEIKGWENPILELGSFLTFQMFAHHQIDRPVTNVQDDYALWNEGRISPFGRDPEFASNGEALQIHAPNDSSFDKMSIRQSSCIEDVKWLNMLLTIVWQLLVYHLQLQNYHSNKKKQHQSASSSNPQQISSLPPISSPLSSQ